mmetsp:Transcript_33199/g.66554  ORF Transcript_33199/g.66554 Transcript_33199/m.66554 type:complete len:294 (-) Transcript_33199:50-931(-)
MFLSSSWSSSTSLPYRDISDRTSTFNFLFWRVLTDTRLFTAASASSSVFGPWMSVMPLRTDCHQFSTDDTFPARCCTDVKAELSPSLTTPPPLSVAASAASSGATWELAVVDDDLKKVLAILLVRSLDLCCRILSGAPVMSDSIKPDSCIDVSCDPSESSTTLSSSSSSSCSVPFLAWQPPQLALRLFFFFCMKDLPKDSPMSTPRSFSDWIHASSSCRSISSGRNRRPRPLAFMRRMTCCWASAASYCARVESPSKIDSELLAFSLTSPNASSRMARKTLTSTTDERKKKMR